MTKQDLAIALLAVDATCPTMFKKKKEFIVTRANPGYTPGWTQTPEGILFSDAYDLAQEALGHGGWPHQAQTNGLITRGPTTKERYIAINWLLAGTEISSGP